MGSKRGVGGGEGDKLGHQVHTRDMSNIKINESAARLDYSFLHFRWWTDY
jgi:hypothetical protein